MSNIQQFYTLPGNLQKEVLDFMSYIAERNGIELPEDDAVETAPKWLNTVHRPKNTVQQKHKWTKKVPVYQNTGEPLSETVRKMRDEEKW